MVNCFSPPAGWCRLVRASILNFIIMGHGITTTLLPGIHQASARFNATRRSPTGGEVSTEPVVVMDTILVVRPRQVEFKWSFDKVTGTVSNTGDAWFKLLIKPGCDSTEEEGDAWYLRPGDVVHQPELRQPGNHYLVYNDKFIKISDSCPAQPPSAD